MIYVSLQRSDGSYVPCEKIIFQRNAVIFSLCAFETSCIAQHVRCDLGSVRVKLTDLFCRMISGGAVALPLSLTTCLLDETQAVPAKSRREIFSTWSLNFREKETKSRCRSMKRSLGKIMRDSSVCRETGCLHAIVEGWVISFNHNCFNVEQTTLLTDDRISLRESLGRETDLSRSGLRLFSSPSRTCSHKVLWDVTPSLWSNRKTWFFHCVHLCQVLWHPRANQSALIG